MATRAKQPPKPTVSAALLAEAAHFGIDPNSIDRQALAEEVRRRWKQENAEAIASSNSWAERNGLPLEHLRMF